MLDPGSVIIDCGVKHYNTGIASLGSRMVLLR